MNIEEIKGLPDYMETTELEKYFNVLLDCVENDNVNSIEISNALYELSDRQWHTYELLNENIKVKLEHWIEKVWNVESEELIKNIISITAHLGLKNSFELLKNSLEKPMRESVRKEIIKAIAELKDNIRDPYSGMK